MSSYEANHVGPPRSPRLWIIETLVVLGVIGFGYFALTMDAARLAPVPVEISDPLLELVR